MSSLNKYCLITGASRGFGKVLAGHFWTQGWHLILLARNPKSLSEVVCSLGERAGQSVHAIAADLSRPEEAERVVNTAKALVPGLDALINNAGIQGSVGPAWENDWDEWLETIYIDLLAPVKLCRLIAPWMIEKGGGSIINLSGGGATSARANFSAYATAKAGLVRFSETLAEELKPLDVRVNCIAPGIMATDMLETTIKKGEACAGKKEYETAIRVLRDGGASMHRAADLCLFLASDAGAGITGKLISAVWDPWESLREHTDDLQKTDVFTLRRIIPKDRGLEW
jgi:3-oxoacyl-[acyl-carrier protein] reductase